MVLDSVLDKTRVLRKDIFWDSAVKACAIGEAVACKMIFVANLFASNFANRSVLATETLEVGSVPNGKWIATI